MPIFVKIEGCPGSATAKGHSDWIEATNLTWNVSRNIAIKVGAGPHARDLGSATIGDVTFTKVPDKSTYKLTKEACKINPPGKKVEIEVVNSEMESTLKYTLTESLISNYSVRSNGENTEEHVTLNFTEVEWSHRPQKADGSLDSPLTDKFNL